MKTSKQLLAGGSVIALLASSMPALAQLDDEVIVTATKRAEGIQDVPVSVAAIDAETLRSNGVVDIADASLYIPNFEFSDASILPNLYIRGIGSGTTHSVEQSVGRFIDDVYIGRAAINLHSLMDVSSIEVLRGPQGTLFGKNTLAGAVIIHTADPSQTFEAGVNAQISDFSTVGGQVGLDGYVSGPLSDQLSARLAVQYRDRDGYIENLLPGPDGGTRKDYGGRLKLLWEGEQTEVGLKLEYMKYEEEGQTPAEATFSFFPGGPAAGQQIPESIWQIFSPEFTYDRNWQSHIDCSVLFNGQDFCPGRDQETGNITLNVSHTLPGKGTFDFITGYQAYDYLHEFVAIDMGAAGGAARFTRDESYSGLTQEIRFTSEEFEKYDFIVGGYYENSTVERLQPSDFNVPAFLFFFPPGAPLPFETDREDWEQDTETFAAFGQVRYHIDDQWSFIVGGRLAYETKEFELERRAVAYQGDAFAGPFTEPPFDFIGDRSETKFTPSATIRWEPNDDLMIFASVSQGHKTGGFSDRPQADMEFDPENNTSYEAGLKGTFFDGAMRANLSLFYMDIEDLQVAKAVPTAGNLSFDVLNAAEATSLGLEFDTQIFLSDTVSIGGDIAITDAEYDDFPDAAAICPVSGGTVVNGLCNFAGLPLIFAPDVKAGAFIQYEEEDVFGEWDLRARANVNYSDGYFTELAYRDTLYQDSYALLGANIQLTSPDNRFRVGLVGRNLTEEHVISWGLQAGFTDFVTPNAPRELMLQLGYRY